MKHGADLSQFFDVWIYVFGIEYAGFDSDVELSAKLTGGSFGNAEKAGEFTVAVTLSSFRNVGRNRDGSAGHLISECIKFDGLDTFQNIYGHPRGTFPDFKILELMIGHLGS